jgi:hypothetical protein
MIIVPNTHELKVWRGFTFIDENGFWIVFLVEIDGAQDAILGVRGQACSEITMQPEDLLL